MQQTTTTKTTQSNTRNNPAKVMLRKAKNTAKGAVITTKDAIDNTTDKAKDAMKATTQTIANVTQPVGQAVMNIGRKRPKNDSNDNDQQDNNKDSVDKVAFACEEIIDSQRDRALVKESQEETMDVLRQHLGSYFMANNNEGTYEEWICQLHPDNVIEKKEGGNDDDGNGDPNGEDEEATQASKDIIDHRFYLEDSHHRILWNAFVSMLNKHELVVAPSNNASAIREQEIAFHMRKRQREQSQRDIFFGVGGGDEKQEKKQEQRNST